MADEKSRVSPQSRRKFLKSGLAAGGALSVREGALALPQVNASRLVDVDVDVTSVADLNEPAHTKATVVLPDAGTLPPTPIVCFGFPGGGYSRRYYTFDMPGSQDGGQAGWHAARGWIFVACDHLGVGESSLPDRNRLVYKNVSAANHETVQEILRRLADGSLLQGYPSIRNPVVLGIGQSMGGCLTVVQQARHGTYDGIGVLGWSSIHTYPPMPPGYAARRNPYIPRDHSPGRGDPPLNSALLEHNRNRWAGEPLALGPNPMAWGFYYDDVPEDIVEQDLTDFPTRAGDVPVWGSPTIPGLADWVLTPGATAPEAASIVVPVLLAFGERDVLDDPWMEPKAYGAAVDISLFVCPRMGHMHNFASTREVFWARIETWAKHVAELKQRLPNDWPSQLISIS